MAKQNGTAGESFQKLFGFLKPYKLSLFFSLVSAFLSVVFSLFLPILLGKAVDKIAGKGAVDFLGLGQILRTMLLVLLLAVGFQWLMNQLNTYLTFHVIEDIRKKAFSHIQAAPCFTESFFAGCFQYFGNSLLSIFIGMENRLDSFGIDSSILLYCKIYFKALLPVFSEPVEEPRRNRRLQYRSDRQCEAPKGLYAGSA